MLLVSTKEISIIHIASAVHSSDEEKQCHAAANEQERGALPVQKNTAIQKSPQASQFAPHSGHSFNQVTESNSTKYESECVITAAAR